jgi:hypothetical protein
LPPERSFFFRAPGGRLVATAENLGAFLDAVWSVDDAVLADHAGRGDFSRWVRDVFANRPVSRQLAKIEQRWGRGEIHDLRATLDRLISMATGRADDRNDVRGPAVVVP